MPWPPTSPEPSRSRDSGLPPRSGAEDAAARLGVSAGLPHLGQLPPLKVTALGIARLPFRVLFKLWWSVEVIGEEHVPASGPVVLAANHLGVIDGPLLVALTKRRSLALAKIELFRNRYLGTVLGFVGQIPVDRRAIDTTAMRRGVQVLRAGRMLTVFPEGTRGSGEMERIRAGGIYLAMVTGAPIVPVALFGTAGPRGAKSAMPAWRSRITIAYGEPIVVARRPWPRRHAEVAELTETVRQRLAEHVSAAEDRVSTRRRKPGLVAGSGEPKRR